MTQDIMKIPTITIQPRCDEGGKHFWVTDGKKTWCWLCATLKEEE